MLADHDRGARLANLIAYLLGDPPGRTRAEIAEHFANYQDGENGRQAFNRDVRTLRAGGIPVVEHDARYRIPPEDFYLDLRLTDRERLALALATAAVPATAEAPTALRAVLGGSGTSLADPPFQAALDVDERLPLLLDAAAARCRVELHYGDRARTLEPHGLVFRDRYWYLRALDVEDGVAKNLRVDRIEGDVAVGPPGAFEPPAVDLAEALPREVWALPGDEPVEAVVEVDAVLAGKAAAEAGAGAVVAWGADGSVTLRLTVTHRPAFRSWLFGFLDHARVVAPPELRDEIVAWLEDVAAGGDRR